MMKHEFEERLGREVSVEEYKEIEYVYNFHPAIPEIGGKERIAELYKVGGLGLIRSMRPCAAEAEERENRMREIRARISELDAEATKLLDEAQSIRELWNA